jgi:hypothetical protein
MLASPLATKPGTTGRKEPPMIQWIASTLAVALLALGAVACGNDTDTDDPPPDPANGACLQGDTDCYETGAETDNLDERVAIANVEALLGTQEDQLPDGVRIARRGTESFPLTEDYVIGRVTVELDDIDGSYTVTTATIELSDGAIVLNL